MPNMKTQNPEAIISTYICSLNNYIYASIYIYENRLNYPGIICNLGLNYIPTPYEMSNRTSYIILYKNIHIYILSLRHIEKKYLHTL